MNPATLVKKDKKAVRNRHNQGQQSTKRKRKRPPESANLSAKSAKTGAKSAKSPPGAVNLRTFLVCKCVKIVLEWCIENHYIALVIFAI